jgi:uncharacterized protein (TIGR02444 family)
VTTDHDGLWAWVLEAYTRPGVADACLELQDAAGQNTPLLLWAAWTASTGRRIDADAREAACDTARVWEDSAVAPLRAVRRTLKVRSVDMNNEDREAVRAQVKAVELEAERRLLLALEALSPVSSGANIAVIDAMAAVARIWATSVPRAGLVKLAAQLSA